MNKCFSCAHLYTGNCRKDMIPCGHYSEAPDVRIINQRGKKNYEYTK